MVNTLEKFTISNISKNLNKINIQISLSHQKPFPQSNLLSHYRFKKRFVKVLPNGSIQGGLCRMIISLIDFSFIRSLVAEPYSSLGHPAYDPVSIFLLDLFRYIDGYKDMKTLLSDLGDEDKGRAYRTYAGISTQHIPSPGTFSNFRIKVGEARYNEIFHVLVDIFHQLEMITFRILSVDGTLYPSRARYRGCCYFCPGCEAIKVPRVIEKVKDRILNRIKSLPGYDFGSECRVYTECPSSRFPQDVKKPKVELFVFRLSFCDGQPTLEQNNTATLFGVKDELDKQTLCIKTVRSHVTHINPYDGSITIRCPKLPKDTDARIGVRRDPNNPDKKQKIFGYNAIFSTSVELHLGIELPVAVNNIAGNAEEGDFLIENSDQIFHHHTCEVKLVIADSKYDAIKNYEYVRDKEAIPIIDYNRRSEDLKRQTLLKRGYDQNGWPFAPCALLCRSNGFDKRRKRLTFCCFKPCLNLKYQAIKNLQSRYHIATCPYLQNQTGFVKHMYIKDHPRLINEIPRGSKHYHDIKNLRSSSERLNSGAKVDLEILDKPQVLNRIRANILTQIAALVLLLKRAFSFIARTTALLRKLPIDKKAHLIKKLTLSAAATSILNLINRKRD